MYTCSSSFFNDLLMFPNNKFPFDLFFNFTCKKCVINMWNSLKQSHYPFGGKSLFGIQEKFGTLMGFVILPDTSKPVFTQCTWIICV